MMVAKTRTGTRATLRRTRKLELANADRFFAAIDGTNYNGRVRGANAARWRVA